MRVLGTGETVVSLMAGLRDLIDTVRRVKTDEKTQRIRRDEGK